MTKELLLFTDTETGGLDPQHTHILTAAFAVYDYEAKKVLNTLEFGVRQDPYHVNAGALNVNKIDLVKHYATASLPSQCVTMLVDFAAPYFTGKITLAGHNTKFDIGYLEQLCRVGAVPGQFEEMFSHRSVDTVAIAHFLKTVGKLNVDNFGLSTLCRKFGVKPGGHTAMGDCLATVQVYEHMLGLV